MKQQNINFSEEIFRGFPQGRSIEYTLSFSQDKINQKFNYVLSLLKRHQQQIKQYHNPNIRSGKRGILLDQENIYNRIMDQLLNNNDSTFIIKISEIIQKNLRDRFLQNITTDLESKFKEFSMKTLNQIGVINTNLHLSNQQIRKIKFKIENAFLGYDRKLMNLAQKISEFQNIKLEEKEVQTFTILTKSQSSQIQSINPKKNQQALHKINNKLSILQKKLANLIENDGSSILRRKIQQIQNQLKNKVQEIAPKIQQPPIFLINQTEKKLKAQNQKNEQRIKHLQQQSQNLNLKIHKNLKQLNSLNQKLFEIIKIKEANQQFIKNIEEKQSQQASIQVKFEKYLNSFFSEPFQQKFSKKLRDIIYSKHIEMKNQIFLLTKQIQKRVENKVNLKDYLTDKIILQEKIDASKYLLQKKIDHDTFKKFSKQIQYKIQSGVPSLNLEKQKFSFRESRLQKTFSKPSIKKLQNISFNNN